MKWKLVNNKVPNALNLMNYVQSEIITTSHVNHQKSPEIVFEKKCKHLTKPVVTIGICVKNCECSVKDAIESITIQDFPHEIIELIVVDDGSTDRTLSIVLSLVSKLDLTVKVFHSEWRGLGPARNVVVDNTTGNYIIWLDGDMTLPKNHVRVQVDFMEQNPNLGIAQAKYGMLNEKNLVVALENLRFVAEDTRMENEWKMSNKLPGTGGSIYRVEAIRTVGGFDNRLTGVGEDEDASYRVKSSGWLVGRSPAFFYEKRAQTWSTLWNKYMWYGYGDYHLYLKNRNVFSLWKMSPPASCFIGLLYAFIAYQLTRKKTVFLMPVHFAFKMTAWCLGFAKGQISFKQN